MKARCLSIVSSEIPFLYSSVGRRPSPCGCLRKWGSLPYPVTSRHVAQDAKARLPAESPMIRVVSAACSREPLLSSPSRRPSPSRGRCAGDDGRGGPLLSSRSRGFRFPPQFVMQHACRFPTEATPSRRSSFRHAQSSAFQPRQGDLGIVPSISRHMCVRVAPRSPVSVREHRTVRSCGKQPYRPVR